MTDLERKLSLRRSYIIQRCYNPNNKRYKNYGGRGIVMCDEWRDNSDSFIKDMISGFSPELSIERIDNNGNYTLENCKWTTNREQSNNRRNNNIIEFNNKKQTLAKWCEELGIKHNTILMRLNKYGWTLEKTLTTKVRG